MLVRNAAGRVLTIIPSAWLLARLELLRNRGVVLSQAVLEQVVRQYLADERAERAWLDGCQMARLPRGRRSGPRMDLELRDALDGQEIR